MKTKIVLCLIGCVAAVLSYPCAHAEPPSATGFPGEEFLRIGDQVVTRFTGTKPADKLRGECFVGETNIKIELVRTVGPPPTTAPWKPGK